ncbi:hypothetical protein GA0070564_102500 [Micromonospora mirobrigensis]|uniref:Uncharacterized protein n=2 Tax=Micromonospora mirobrigensis TaxID=262898 RepID=A0A1C4WTW8_9ACTN|nr:hypothetical protein GA0070564_102500 [Micromonospora mirobrigensis]
MLVAARRIESDADQVRYEFGFDHAFDRILRIDRHTLGASVEDGVFDSAASAITAKIFRSWQSGGDYPLQISFAS